MFKYTHFARLFREWRKEVSLYARICKSETRTLAHRLRGQALASAWVAEQVDNEPMALARHKVVELARCSSVVRLDECLEDLLVLRWDDELLERLVVPLELLYTLGDELDCKDPHT